MSTSRRCLFSLLSIPLLSTLLFLADGQTGSAADSPADALATARHVDQLISHELQASGGPLSDRAGDED